MAPNQQRGLRPLILPELVATRARRGARGSERPPPINPEAMLQLRQSWAVKLEDGIEHAESGGWGLSREDYRAVAASSRRARRLAMPATVGSSRDVRSLPADVHAQQLRRPLRHRHADLLRRPAGFRLHLRRLRVGERAGGRPERGASTSFEAGASLPTDGDRARHTG